MTKSKNILVKLSFLLCGLLYANILFPQKEIVRLGLNGIMVDCSCEVKDSLVGGEKLSLLLKGEDNLPVESYPDAGVYYHEADGRLAVPSLEKLTQGRQNYHFFIPYTAIALPPGRHKLTALITVRGEAEITCSENLPTTLSITMPKQFFLRVALRHIAIKPVTDPEDNWDYALFSKEEGLPDPKWTIKRGSQELYTSKKQKNTYLYTSPETEISQPFITADQDQLRFLVYDHDLISSSDLIEDFDFSPTSDTALQYWQLHAQGNVEEMNLKWIKTAFPRINIRGFRLDTAANWQGIDGVSLKFTYKIDENWPLEDYQIYLKEASPEKSNVIANLKVLSGPLRKDRSGRMFCKEKKGDVSIFIPHYSLSLKQTPQTQFILEGRLEILKSGYLIEKRTTALYPKRKVFQDVKSKKPSIWETVENGVTGLKVKYSFDISPVFLQDLQPDSLFVIPRIKLLGQQIPYELYRTGGGLLWDKSRHAFNIKRTASEIEFFIPYYLIREQNGALITALNTTNTFLYAKSKTKELIGERKDTIQRVLAPIQYTGLGIEQVKIRKSLFSSSSPTLRWKVYLGDSLVYASGIVSQNRRPNWGKEDRARIWLCPEDIIRIEILSLQNDGKERLLSLWQGQASALPYRKKGHAPLWMRGIKKVYVEVRSLKPDGSVSEEKTPWK